MDYEIVKALLVTLVMGFAIGMQRSLTYREKDSYPFAGSRTFALIALSGYLAAWLGQYVSGMLLVTVAVLGLMFIVAYAFKVLRLNHWGMTTQIAALVTFFLGVMIRFGLENYAVFLGVLLIVILEIKPGLKRLESRIDRRDIDAVVLLLAMTFVILPMLPDRLIGPYHLFNPYQTWLMAIIIAGISFVGYVAVRILGQKHGIFLTGAAGGLVSSTGVSVSLSKMFRDRAELLDTYAGGIAVACTLMYLRVLFESFIVHPVIARHLAPAFFGAFLSGLLFSYWLYRRSSGATKIQMESPSIETNPLQLSEAIKFGLLFGVVYGAVAYVQGRYGNFAIYLVSFFSGLTDVDAITLSLSELNRSGKLALVPAMTGIVIASVTNSLVKLGIVYWLGGTKLGWRVTQFFLLTLGILGLGLWLSIYFQI
ncbi:MgtC/SapB family protein [Nitratifractor sp.]